MDYSNNYIQSSGKKEEFDQLMDHQGYLRSNAEVYQSSQNIEKQGSEQCSQSGGIDLESQKKLIRTSNSKEALQNAFVKRRQNLSKMSKQSSKSASRRSCGSSQNNLGANDFSMINFQQLADQVQRHQQNQSVVIQKCNDFEDKVL